VKAADILVLKRANESLREAYSALANRRRLKVADMNLIERDLKALDVLVATLSNSEEHDV